MSDVTREMPKYQSHKQVWALKIKEVDYADFDDGRANLVFEEEGYAPIEVSGSWTGKHEPQVGGYYVVYENGHTSFSPAQAFESGYTAL